MWGNVKLTVWNFKIWVLRKMIIISEKFPFFYSLWRILLNKTKYSVHVCTTCDWLLWWMLRSDWSRKGADTLSELPWYFWGKLMVLHLNSGNCMQAHVSPHKQPLFTIYCMQPHGSACKQPLFTACNLLYCMESLFTACKLI